MRRVPRFGRVAEIAEVPAEALLNLSRIEIVGQMQVRVENHRGLQHFRSNQVILAMHQGRVIIDGQALTIGWVDQSDLLVSGQVLSVRFEKETP